MTTLTQKKRTAPAFTHDFSVDTDTQISTPKPALTPEKIEQLKSINAASIAAPVFTIVKKYETATPAIVFSRIAKQKQDKSMTLHIPHELLTDMTKIIHLDDDKSGGYLNLSSAACTLIRFALDELERQSLTIHSARI